MGQNLTQTGALRDKIGAFMDVFSLFRDIAKTLSRDGTDAAPAASGSQLCALDPALSPTTR